MQRARKRYPFYIGITTLVVAIVVVLTGLFLWISHRESKTAAVKMADRLFTEINQKTLERYENALESVDVLAGTVVRMPGIALPPTGDGRSYAGLELMLEALDFYNYLFSLYTGYDDGSFIQVIAARDDVDIQTVYKAPSQTYFILRSITTDSQGNRHEQRQFLDYDRRVIGSQDEPDPTYDPRVRPWYIRAKEETTAFLHTVHLVNIQISSHKYGSFVYRLDLLQQFSICASPEENMVQYQFPRPGGPGDPGHFRSGGMVHPVIGFPVLRSVFKPGLTVYFVDQDICSGCVFFHFRGGPAVARSAGAVHRDRRRWAHPGEHGDAAVIG